MVMRTLRLALLASAFALPAFAATVAVKDANGSTVQMQTHVDANGTMTGTTGVCDPTNPQTCAPVSNTGGLRVTAGPATTGGLLLTSIQVAANTTPVALKTSPGQLYGLEAFNNSSAVAYVKIYNATLSSTTCGTGTPIYRGMIPAATNGGAGYVSMNAFGVPFTSAITVCITAGFADTDTTAVTAGNYLINYFYQ